MTHSPLATRLPRRRFLQAAVAGVAACGLPAFSRAQVSGANEEIRVGVIGVRGRGGDHIQGFGAVPGVRVAALCDCDAAALDSAAQKLRGQGQAWRRMPTCGNCSTARTWM